MKQTLGVHWLDTIEMDEFLEMLEDLPEFVSPAKIPNREDSDSIRLPLFNLEFDKLCKKLGRIPSQAEYARHYADVARPIIDKHELDVRYVKERAKRNIFSLIQEYAIYIIMRDKGYDGLFDRGWDLKGVDFIVYKKKSGNKVGILSHGPTTKARDMSYIKDKLRRKGITFPTYSLIADYDLLDTINGVSVFTKWKNIVKGLVKH